MAQLTTFVYRAKDSTVAINDHIAKILSPGVYSGLDVYPSDSPFSLSISAGYALTDEGVKVEETTPLEGILQVSVNNGITSRKDLVVMHHRYDMEAVPNSAVYRIIQGDNAGETYINPEAPYNKLQEGDIPLAEITVGKDALTITSADIFNLRKVYTTEQLEDLTAQGLFLSMGNFSTQGWEPSGELLMLNVSEGAGVLGGRPSKSNQASSVKLIPASYLYTQHTAGVNLTLTSPIKYATKLHIFLKAVDAPIKDATIKVRGKILNSTLTEEIVKVPDISVGGTADFCTENEFQEVDVDGIDCLGDSFAEGTTHQIYIEDYPVAKMYAVGGKEVNTAEGKEEIVYSETSFKAVYGDYTAKNNELLIAKVLTDKSKIIKIEKQNTENQFNTSAELKAEIEHAVSVFSKGLLDAEKAVIKAGIADVHAKEAKEIAEGIAGTANDALENSVSAKATAEGIAGTANEAKNLASAANTNAADALVKAEEAKTAAGLVETTANEAKEAATAAQTSAHEASAKADAAYDATVEAIAAVNEAVNTAASANRTAAEAKSTANEAKTLSTEAKNLSTEAKTLSTEAKTLSSEAKSIADEAKAIADGVDAKATSALDKAGVNEAAITELQNAVIGTDKLGDKSVTKPKLEDTLQTSIDQIAINTQDIADLKNNPAGGTPDDNSVSTVKIQDNAVTSAKIQDNAVTSAKIQNNAVTSAKIQDAAVSNVKLDAALQQHINVTNKEINDMVNALV